MRTINQWVALAGAVVAVGAGCATESDDVVVQEPVAEQTEVGSGRLDARGAAALDDKHASALGRAFAEPGTCYSIAVDAGRFVRLNVETQTVTPVDTLPSVNGSMVASMGHFGGSLLTCQEGQLAIYDLDGDSVKTVALPCHAVTGDGDHVWVMEPNEGAPRAVINEYSSFASLVAGTPDRTLDVPNAFSLGAGAGRLITAWHSTDEVNLVNLADGSISTSPLQGYDNWIFGSSEVLGKRYMVGGWAEDSRGLHVFEPATGANLGDLFTDTWFAGLTCDNR